MHKSWPMCFESKLKMYFSPLLRAGLIYADRRLFWWSRTMVLRGLNSKRICVGLSLMENTPSLNGRDVYSFAISYEEQHQFTAVCLITKNEILIYLWRLAW